MRSGYAVMWGLLIAIGCGDDAIKSSSSGADTGGADASGSDECQAGKGDEDGSCSCGESFIGDGGAQGCTLLPTTIEVSGGALTPAYDPDVTTYQVDVGIWQRTVDVNVAIAGGALVTVNDTPAISGEATRVALGEGATPVKVDIRAGGASRTYTLTITHPKVRQDYLKSSIPYDEAAFGGRISLSGDGTTLAVTGGTAAGNDRVYVFTRTAGRWTEQAALEPPSSPSRSVSLSEDGSTLAVGHHKSISLYVRTGSSWSEPVPLTAADRMAGDLFGALALSADGATLAVYARVEETSRKAAVYIFAATGADWSQRAKLLDASSGTFESSLALSGDGQTLALGVPSESGTTSVFTRHGENWSEPIRLTGPAAKPYTFGESVSLSADGNTLAVGSDGQVHLFKRTDRKWSEQGRLGDSYNAAATKFGMSVSLSGDGNILAVGAFGESSASTGVNSTPTSGAPASGATYMFTRMRGIWSPQSYLKASNTGEADRFGSSVSLSRDGATLAVGAPEEDSLSTGVNSKPNEDADGPGDASGAGAVYVFQ